MARTWREGRHGDKDVDRERLNIVDVDIRLLRSEKNNQTKTPLTVIVVETIEANARYIDKYVLVDCCCCCCQRVHHGWRSLWSCCLLIHYHGRKTRLVCLAPV